MPSCIFTCFTKRPKETAAILLPHGQRQQNKFFNLTGTSAASENQYIEEAELSLYRNLALNGMDYLSEAYGAASRDPFGHLSAAAAYAKELLSPAKYPKILTELLSWAIDHPAEAQVLAGNFEHLRAQFGSQNPIATALSRASTQNQVRDLVAGARESIAGIREEKPLSPELIAVLHASSYLPAAVSSYKALMNPDMVTQGVGDVVEAGVGLAAPAYVAKVANVATRVAVGFARTSTEVRVAEYLRSNRDAEIGLSALTTAMGAENLTAGFQKARDLVVGREVMRSLGTKISDTKEGGFFSSIKRSFQEFTTWFKTSSLGEKIIRGIGEVGIPVAIVGTAATIGITAAIANPVGGVILGAIASIGVICYGAYKLSKWIGYGIRTLGQNSFEMETTKKKVNDEMTRIRIESAKLFRGNPSLYLDEELKLLLKEATPK